MGEIQRYDMVEHDPGYHSWHRMECSDDGDYVKHDDHAREIAQLTAQVERLRALVPQLDAALTDCLFYTKHYLEEAERTGRHKEAASVKGVVDAAKAAQTAAEPVLETHTPFRSSAEQDDWDECQGVKSEGGGEA